MRAGILAAGWGERLRESGVATPKPLVSVGGRTLLAHALGAVAEAGAEEAVVMVNEAFAGAVAGALEAVPPPLPTRLLRRTTASSLETFARIAEHLRDEPFGLVAMVDGIFRPGAARDFGEAAQRIAAGRDPGGARGLIGVTDRRDDDRPLRVACGEPPLRPVLAIGPGAAGSPWSTAGLYLLPREAFRGAPAALAEGLSALRLYLERLVEEGVPLRAHPLGVVVDVDRADDLAAAEAGGAA